MWIAWDDVTDTTSTIGNPYMFTGRRLDPETMHMYFRYRPYSTNTGTLISRDLIGYLDSMILYEYVRSMPVRFDDPMGRWLCDHKCSPEGRVRNARITDWDLKYALSPVSPGTQRGLVSAAEAGIVLSVVVDLASVGKGAAEGFNELCAEALAMGVDQATSGIMAHIIMDKGLRFVEEAVNRQRGVRIWVQVSWEVCELESCCVWWKRRNWQKHEAWHQCSANGDFESGEGFSVDDRDGIAAALGGCFREAMRTWVP